MTVATDIRSIWGWELGSPLAGTGNFNIESSIVRSGVYSGRATPSGSGLGYDVVGGSIAADGSTATIANANLYAEVWIYIVSAPSSSEIILYFQNTLLAAKLEIRLTSARKLELWRGTTSIDTSGTTVIPVNTWTKISAKCGTSATVGAYEVKINGVTEYSGTTNTTATNHGLCYVGKVVNRNSAGYDVIFDDFACATDAYPSSENYRIYGLIASGAGNYSSGWALGTGSTFAEVDETPPDDDTSYIRSDASGNVMTFAMTDLPSDVDVVHIVLAQARTRKTVNGSTALAVRVRSGSTDVDTSNLNPATTYRGQFLIRATDPATSSAWTISAVNALEVGVVNNNAGQGRCSQVIAEVMYRSVITLTPSGIATAEAFGSHTVANAGGSQSVSPSGIASAEAFGTAQLNQQVIAQAIASAEAFGTTVVVPGVVTVIPSGIASAEAFGTAQLNQQVIAEAIATAEAFGTPVVVLGAITVSPSAIASGEAFGDASVLPGAVFIIPDGVATAEEFGTPTVSLVIFPSGVASAEAFGDATLVPGAVTVSPSGIASAEAFGSAVLTSLVTLLASGIASGEAFGTPQINLVIFPDAIDSEEAFGDAEVALGAAIIAPDGIASAEAFGTALFLTYVTAQGIASAEVFGTAKLNLTIAPTAIASAEAFGTAVLAPGPVTVSPSGIASAEAFGSATVTIQLVIRPSGIASAEAFGTPRVVLITFSGGRVSVVVLDADGNVVGSPLVNIIEASIMDRLDKLGEFSLTIPATDSRASFLVAGREVVIYREGEGEIFRGRIGRRRMEARD